MHIFQFKSAALKRKKSDRQRQVQRETKKPDSWPNDIKLFA